MQINWTARDGGAAQCDCEPVQETVELMHRESSGLISRVGVISPQAREAAKRREVAGRVERQLREERRAQWMATVRGPGWARRGRCHME